MTLAASDIQTFSSQGILAMRRFVSRKQTTRARDAIFSELTRLNLKKDGKLLPSKIQGLPVFQQTGRLGQLVGSHEEVDQLFSEGLLEVMSTLAGSQLRPSVPRSQILLSFPHKTEWTLKNLNWHLDLEVPKANQIPGVQAFILIDDVEPKGGATLALAGSHRLHYVSYEDNAHGILKKKSDFLSSPEKYLEPQKIEGIPVQITEMSGRAGDVYLMDLRVLHTPSVNSRKSIRMMATNRYLK